MAYAAVAVMVVGALVAAYGAYQQGQAAEYQAKSQKYAAEQEADISRKQGLAAEAAAREETRRRLATYGPAGAASGISTTSGSLLESELEAARLGEYNAQLEGYPGKLGAARGSYQAKLFGQQARYAGTQKWVGVGTSLLGSASSIGGQMYSGSSYTAPRSTSMRGNYSYQG